MIQRTGEQLQDFFLSLISGLFGKADEFRNPVFLFLLLLIPAFLVWYFWWYDPRRLMVRLSYDPEKMSGHKGRSAALRYIPLLFQISAWFFLVLGLARPQSANELREKKTQGVDIMILLDVSESMNTGDIPPSRLTVAKRVALDFVNNRQNDRIGMVLFASTAYSYCPLTLDYDLVKKLIEPISSSMMFRGGTAIGTAIGIGINRLEKSDAKSKIMILITDGASNAGILPPITTAEMAAEKGIRIYAISMGTPEFNGQATDFDEATMIKIAETTGGKYFQSENEDKFKEVMNIISNLERTEFKEEVKRELTDVYPPVVATGLALLLISFIFSVTFLHNPFEG